ncbi:MAG: hypothetical protein SFX18_12110 [Pirellulales bacterium]|nr:hypothetical protein [Pirellulales bacterium]
MSYEFHEFERLKCDFEVLRDSLSSSPASDEIKVLQHEVAELRLYLAGLIKVLQQKNTVTLPELQEWLGFLDQSDGAKDHEFRGNPLTGQPAKPAQEQKTPEAFLNWLSTVDLPKPKSETP